MPESLQELKEYQKSNTGNVLDFCAEAGLVSAQLMPILRQKHSLPVVDLLQTEINSDTARLLPQSVSFEHMVIPFYEDEAGLCVAMADPDSSQLQSFIEQKTGKKIVPYLAHQSAIRQIIEVMYRNSAEDSYKLIIDLINKAQKITQTPEAMAQEVPIISLVNHLILYGLRSKASDMHVEPQEHSVKVRFRIDGLLHDQFTLPKELLAPIVARIKILSKLRLDEHMRPQDGRFTFNESGYQTAVRISFIPILFGQKVALRFLDTDSEKLSLDSLGFGNEHRRGVERSLGYSNGMILVTGPTGSGKTTTLYALIKAIKKHKINISTIEDPIEYHLEGANQMQVNTQVGLTFAEGLRSILRQDPDIIMVGEIRDRETATIAINAALTGHLVFSSLHTNSAAAAIPRLLDMGIEPYLIASTLRTVIGQRLVRQICPSCSVDVKTTMIPEALASKRPAEGTLTVARGKGCEKCMTTGYRGRIGIFEMLNVDEQIHQLIISRAHTSTIEDAARKRGMQTIQEHGFSKVLEKVTSLEEVARVIQ